MNYIDLTCPAEIFRTALPTEDIPAATMTLYNLSDRVIASVEVSLRLLDAAGGETERLSFRGRALNGRPHSTFLLTVPCAPGEGIRSIEATVEKVWYADNEVWRRDPANAVEYTPNALPVSPALTNLKYAAGETAVGWPSLQNGLWVCVCGRPNPENEPFCARCGQSKDTVFTRFSPEAVEAQIKMKTRQLDLSSRNMREDTIRLQRMREEEYRERKARRGTRIRILVALAAALGLAAGALLYGSPALRLAAARHAKETGDIAGAKEAFTSLGTFGGADAEAAECVWLMALDAAEKSESAGDLAAASEMLRQVPDRPEAAEKANETDLLRARVLLEQGDWKGAEAALSLVPEDWEGRETLIREARMADARSLMKAGDYAAAREIFLSLGDMEGAKELASECVYLTAAEQIADSDWAGAIQTLSAIQDYRDSRSLTLECHYHLAETLEAAGDIAGASNEYLMAGDWSNAKTRMAELTCSQADALYAAGDLRGAQKLYASVPDWPEAAEKDRGCRYTLAKAAIDDHEYTLALEYLTDLPAEYEELVALRNEASYMKAKNLVKQEKWAEAAELLADLDREALIRKYKDIEDLYLQACAGAGIEACPATPEPEETPGTPEPGDETAPPEPGTETPAPAPDPVTPAPSPEETAAEPQATESFLVTEDEMP